MENEDKKITDEEVAERKRRRKVAMHLQEIESNPLTEEDVELFDMFDRERWPSERRIQYLAAQAKMLAEK